MGCTFSEQSWWEAAINDNDTEIKQHLTQFGGHRDQNIYNNNW